MQGFPISLSIEPTTTCNLRCPQCPSGLRSFTRPTGNLDPALAYRLIDENWQHLLYLQFYFQGEPFIHPKFLEMVSYAAKKKIFTATSTNAHFLSEDKARDVVASGLSRLIISLDGTTQDAYSRYRINGKLESVLSGTKRLVDWKKKLKSATPDLVFQFLVMRHNEHQMQAAKDLAKTIGVDRIWFKTTQVYDHQQGSDLIPENGKYSRYQTDKDGSYRIKNPFYNHCWKMWHSCVVTWDGKVIPCCFDKDASHPMGDLLQDSLQTIWHNQAYHEFRKKLLNARTEIEICRNCSEGTKIWI